MFETHVINLKKDIKNFHELKKKLVPKKIYPIRFDAIYGKEIKNFKPYDKYITKFCQIFGPRGLVGCGLSHYVLLDKIYKKYQSDPKYEYTLILEDDVTPLFENKNTIESIIKNMPQCDILLLFCQGNCYNSSDRYIKHKSEIIGSTAAYLIKNSSIPKLLSKKLFTHVDFQWYHFHDVDVCIYNDKLFSVDNGTSYNLDTNQKKSVILSFLDNYIKLDNTSLSQSLYYKLFRIPIIDIELTIYDVIIFLIFLIFIVLLYCYLKIS